MSTLLVILIVGAIWFWISVGAFDPLKCRLFHRKHWRIVHTAGFGGIYIEECGKCGQQHMTRH